MDQLLESETFRLKQGVEQIEKQRNGSEARDDVVHGELL